MFTFYQCARELHTYGSSTIKSEMKRLKDDINTKSQQIALLEKKIADASPNKMTDLEIMRVSSLIVFVYSIFF